MTRNLLLIAIAMLTCTVSFSQTNKSGSSNAPKKGYYAIGNNAAKYPQGTVVVTNGAGAVNKGYYAQRKHKQKADSLKNNPQTFAISNNPVPQTKGFYSQSKYQQPRLVDVAKDTTKPGVDSVGNP